MSSPPSSPSPSSTDSRRRHGKAQMCLLKILRIISLFPAAIDDVSPKEHLGHTFDFDLNVDLGAPKEKIEPLEHPTVVTGGGADCVFITDLIFEDFNQEEQSEISHVEDQSSGIDFNGFSEELGQKKLRDEGGYLDLLIEAARLILGGDCDKIESPAPSTTAEKGGGGRRRKRQFWPALAAERWYAEEFEDTSPVVKSKRGRNQVLPLKYRDSVVEPLVRRRRIAGGDEGQNGK